MSPETAHSTATASGMAVGLRGVAVSDSKISFVDGANGRLLYRGYDILELAEQSTFEETSYLLLHGELPTKSQLREFSKSLAAERKVPRSLVRLLKAIPPEAHPMDALRTAVSFLGALDPETKLTDPLGRIRVGRRLIAQFPTILAANHRIRTGQPVVAPRRSGTHAGNFLRMLTGRDPDPAHQRAVDAALVLHADHEFNASTFSARVTASTLSDLYSSVASALAALKGPLHGGANRAVMDQLLAIGDVGRVEPWVKDQLARHEKIMGFGHAVYKTIDPRATVLKRMSEEAARISGDKKWYEISVRLQDVVYREKQLWPNVDFYSPSLYHVLGIPHDLFTGMFALSRISGWVAHILEQYADNKLIRPVANYAGPTLRAYTPAERRR